MGKRGPKPSGKPKVKREVPLRPWQLCRGWSKRFTPVVELPGERWVSVFGLEGRYEVSDLGRVRSYVDNHGRIMPVARLHLPRPNSRSGVLMVTMALGGYSFVELSLARLVYESFIAKLGPEYMVRYNDGNVYNCTLENLRAERRRDYFRAYILADPHQPPTRKLMPEDVLAIRERLAAGEGVMSVAGDLDMDFTFIYDIWNGKGWAYIGGVTRDGGEVATERVR